MKKNLLAAILISLGLGLSAQTQLLNGALNSWNGASNPQYWATNYSDYLQQQGSSVVNLQTLVSPDFGFSSTGQGSVKMTVSNVNAVMQTGYINACANLNGQQAGTDEQHFTGSPDSLAFDFYYTTTNFTSDEAQVTVTFYDASGTQINIGNLGFLPFAYTNSTAWRTVEMPLGRPLNAAYISVQFEPTLPTQAAVDPNPGTTLWIDNVKMIYNDGCPHNIAINPINPTCHGGNNGSVSISWTNVPNSNMNFTFNTLNYVDYTGPFTPTTNPYISNSLGGPNNYVVQIQTITGCSITDTFAIGSNPVLIGQAISTSATSGNNGTATASATGGVPPYSYSWNTGQTQASISGLATGTYNITVTDHAGCTVTASTVVGGPGEPAVNTTPATGITLTSATLNETIDPEGATVSTGFEWGNSPAYGNAVVGTPGTLSGSTQQNASATITGLTPNTTYYFRASGSANGNIYYGALQQFSTGNTGIQQVDLAKATIYPNPAKQQFTVNTQSYEASQLNIYNLLGQKVITQTITQPVSNIDVSALANGIYTVTLVKDEAVKAFREVIINE